MTNPKTQFLHEWLSISDFDMPITPNFSQKAISFGIDLTQKYFAVVVNQKNGIQTLNVPLAFNLDTNHIIYILRQFEHANVITNHLSLPARVGIGTQHFDLSGTIREALQALCFTTNTDKLSIASYVETCRFQPLIKSHLADPELINLFNDLIQVHADARLLDTFWLYTITNHNIIATANQLHIHRKTVDYCLNKLHKLTQYNPHDIFDTIVLIASYLTWRTQNLPALLRELQSISNSMLPRDHSVADI